mmetsp:Transcript_63177/g.100441  ORF Transcript_63177/g.100441 Transcript_63177/m.100441 type:complete len:313 (+) Transcript_63177:1-939(+)
MGDVHAFCRLMVIHNHSVKQVMTTDESSRQNVLHRICTFGHIHALKFIRSMLSESVFMDHLFASNNTDQKPVEYAVRYSQVAVVEYLFRMQSVKERYQDNMDLYFRLLDHLFALNKNHHLIDFVLNELQIKDRVSEILRHKYPAPTESYFTLDAATYHKYNILVDIVEENTLATLKYVVPFIGGEQAFLSNVLQTDWWARDVAKVAATAGKVDILRYVLEMAITYSETQVVGRVVSQKGMKAAYTEQCNLSSLVMKLNAHFDEEICQTVVKELGITEQRLKEFSADQDLDVAKILKVVADKKWFPDVLVVCT